MSINPHWPARRSFIDRPAARIVALLVAAGALGVLAYIHRDDLRGVAKKAGGEAAKPADDPFTACMAEHAKKIDQMVKEGLVQPGMAETFKSRAEGLCRAAAAGATKAK